MEKIAQMVHRALRLALTLSLLASLGGCRSVWAHPEATQERYGHDLYWCRYGQEPPADFRKDRGNPVRIMRDWQQCMVALGWEKGFGWRWDPPYEQPQP